MHSDLEITKPRMKNKLHIPEWVILLAVASTLLYVVSRNLPLGIGSFRFLWGPFSLIIIFVYRPNVFIKSPMIFVLLFGVIFVGILHYILWNYMDDWNKRLLLEDLYSLIVFTAMWNYFRINNYFGKLSLISKYAFIFIIITLLGTNIALIFDPDIVRDSAIGFGEDLSQKTLANLTGVAYYGYAQAMVLLIPILVYHILKRKRMVFSRNILIVILILLLITIIRSNVFANLLVAAFITLLSFLGSHNRYRTYGIITLFVIVYVFVPSSFYSNIFFTLGSYFEQGTELNYKLGDFALFIKNPEITATTGAGGRAERYPMLFDALLANPLWGHASYESSINISAGGHLYWMNKLAQWGIPGFMFFIFVLYRIYKSIITVLRNDEIKFYYFLSVAAFIMLGLMKNMDGREPWLMIIVVIPGLFLLPYYQASKNENRIIKYNKINGKKLKRTNH